MNHAFGFSDEAGPHFADNGGVEGNGGLADYIPGRFTCPNTVTLPSTNHTQR